MINEKIHLVEDLYRENIKQVPTRDGYGHEIVELGERDKNVVVLCADLIDSTRSNFFKARFPERFIEVGVDSAQISISRRKNTEVNGNRS